MGAERWHGHEHARRQLAAVSRIDDLLRGAGVEYRLFGGWAVDFHAGRITRAHDDIDIAVWDADGPRLAALLARDGWRHAPEPDEDGGTGYERDRVRLELTYLVPDAGAVASIPLRHGPVPWRGATSPPVMLELHGTRAAVVALDLLVGDKSRPRGDPDDAAKDSADAAVLDAVVRRS